MHLFSEIYQLEQSVWAWVCYFLCNRKSTHTYNSFVFLYISFFLVSSSLLNFIKKETLAQVLSFKSFEISKNTFFNRTTPVVASATCNLQVTHFSHMYWENIEVSGLIIHVRFHMNGELVLYKAAVFFFTFTSCWHWWWVVDTPSCIGFISRTKEMYFLTIEWRALL